MALRRALPLTAVALASAATGPADNGLAVQPPMGWRHWNQWQGAINQDIVEGNIRALADRSRLVDGAPASLADVGYVDAGIDDGWQACGHYGPEAYRYHDADGSPVVDGNKFPDLRRLTSLAHSLNLTAGWYGNACGCVAGCCSDHCNTLECFAGDVNATLSFGFDSYKLDGCGAQRDIELWARMFNHSLFGKSQGMLIENCHDGDGDTDTPGFNEPYYDAAGELWCPFHTYRTSGDAAPTYGSLLGNLNSTIRLANANLSVPGCWAYPDMMEIGVTAMQGKHDCGPLGNETCMPLTATEARSHFGAWCIVSSPLVLGFDLRDEEQLERHWAAITNRDAIEVNQDYAGFSGSLFAQSADLTTFRSCTFTAGQTCEWPSWTAWYKPLSGRDARQSTMAVLLMNNGDAPATLAFDFAEVPGLGRPSACDVYDVWGRRSLGALAGRFATPSALLSRDSAFVTLTNCSYDDQLPILIG